MRKSAGVLAEKGLLRVRGGPFYADRLQFCQLCAFISQTLVHQKINTQPFDLSIFLTAHIKILSVARRACVFDMHSQKNILRYLTRYLFPDVLGKHSVCECPFMEDSAEGLPYFPVLWYTILL